MVPPDRDPDAPNIRSSPGDSGDRQADRPHRGVGGRTSGVRHARTYQQQAGQK